MKTHCQWQHPCAYVKQNCQGGQLLLTQSAAKTSKLRLKAPVDKGYVTHNPDRTGSWCNQGSHRILLWITKKKKTKTKQKREFRKEKKF